MISQERASHNAETGDESPKFDNNIQKAHYPYRPWWNPKLEHHEPARIITSAVVLGGPSAITI